MAYHALRFATMNALVVDQPGLPAAAVTRTGEPWRTVPFADRAPGACLLSGANEGRLVDTGLDIDESTAWGRIYVGENSVSHMAQMLGFTPPVASARARDQMRELEARVACVEAENRALIAANEALIAAGYTAPVPAAGLVVPAGAVEDVLCWVIEPDDPADAADRAQAAYAAELLEAVPRGELVAELESFLIPEE